MELHFGTLCFSCFGIGMRTLKPWPREMEMIKGTIEVYGFFCDTAAVQSCGIYLSSHCCIAVVVLKCLQNYIIYFWLQVFFAFPHPPIINPALLWRTLFVYTLCGSYLTNDNDIYDTTLKSVIYCDFHKHPRPNMQSSPC